MHYEHFPKSSCFNIDSSFQSDCIEKSTLKTNCHEPSDYINAHFDFDFMYMDILIVIIDLDEFETLINENDDNEVNSSNSSSSYSTELSLVFNQIPENMTDLFFTYSGIENQEEDWVSIKSKVI